MDKLFKHKNFWWQTYLNRQGFLRINGPLCPGCYADLLDESFSEKKCQNCGKEIEEIGNLEKRRQAATIAYDAKGREYFEKISLDEPLILLKTRDANDKYFIEGRLKQKDGKLIGVVYFGEKNKEQSKEDYSQIFIDLNDEQLRFDKSNKHPKNILCKFVAEFPDVKVEQKFKTKK